MITASLSTIATNLPPVAPGLGGMALTLMQSWLTISNFSMETNSSTRTKYSKFVDVQNSKDNDLIDSKDGMTIIYLPAFLVTAILNILPAVENLSLLPQQSLAGQFLVIHFLKRVLEVFYLHKYSGKVSRGVSSTIGIYYTLVSVLILCVASPPVSGAAGLTSVLGTGASYRNNQ